MCDFDCFNCKYPDCVIDDDVLDVYIRYKRKHGEYVALMVVKKYVELKEAKNVKKRSNRRSESSQKCY